MSVFHGAEQIVLRGQTTQHRIRQSPSVRGINIAEGRLIGVGLHGNAREHFIHVDSHEADAEGFVLHGPVDRNGDDDLLPGFVRTIQRNFRLRKRCVVKGIIVNVVLCPQRGVNQSFGIDKGEFIQREELLHTPLIRRQPLHAAQILLIHQINGDVDGVNSLPQVFLHDLFPASCQFVQIEEADRVDRLFGALLCAVSHPNRPGYHQQHKNEAPCDDGYGRAVSETVLHSSHTSCAIFEPAPVPSVPRQNARSPERGAAGKSNSPG